MSAAGRKSVCVFFVLFAFHFLNAQETSIENTLSDSKEFTKTNVKGWTVKEGLPNNSITSLILSSTGHIWFGTYSGLVRFDGVNFTLFNSALYDEFLVNGVLAVYEDSEENIWVGTNGGGLLKYKDGKFELFNTHPKLRNAIVTAIQEDSENRLWISTKKGLLIRDKGSFSVPQLQYVENENISHLLLDNEDKVWVSTKDHGLICVDKYVTKKYTTEDGLPTDIIRQVFQDSDNTYWVGTDKGLSRIKDGRVWPLQDLPGAPTGFINDIMETHEGEIFFATDQGLLRFTGHSFERIKAGAEDLKIIQSVLEDHEGNIWVGTYRMGLYMLKERKFVNYDADYGLENEIVNAIFQDSNAVWIGTDAGLGILLNEKVTHFNLGEDVSLNRVRDIIRDSRGRLLLCTYNGLVEFDGQVKSILKETDGLSSNRMRKIMEDSQGNIWIGTASGLDRIAPGGEVTNFDLEDGLSNNFIMSMAEDEEGKIWVGTNGGGIYYLSEEKLINVPLNPKSTGEVVFDIFQDEKGDIWVSTNNGIFHLNGGDPTVLSVRKGFPTNTVFQILQDANDDFWICTNVGVISISSEEFRNSIDGDAFSQNFKLFDSADGLLAGNVTPTSKSILTEEGFLLFATPKGVTKIDPSNIPINRVVPPVSIDAITLNGEFINPMLNPKITIPPGKNRIQFSFNSLTYYAPEKSNFKFQLKGFDKEWINAIDKRYAVYTNLPPGSYEFKVIASNNDNLWNENGATIRVHKKAYFYQSIWFYIIVSSSVLSIGFLYNRIRLKQLASRNRHLAKLVSERTRDIEEQKENVNRQKEELSKLNSIKDKIFSIISHDLRSPLHSIQGVLTLLGEANLTNEDIQQLTRNLNSQVTHLKDFLENLLRWSKNQMQGIEAKPVELSLKKLALDNIGLLTPEADKKNITLYDEVDDEAIVLADEEMVKLVIRNLLANAIKFTKIGGNVKLISSRNNGSVIFSVCDDGVGIKEEHLPKIFDISEHYSEKGTAKEVGTGLGLILCKEFIEKNQGKIWVDSIYGQGTTFSFELKSVMALAEEEL